MTGDSTGIGLAGTGRGDPNSMKWRLQIAVLFIFLIGMTVNVVSQWLIDITSFTGYSDNITGIYNAKEDYIVIPNIQFSRITESYEIYYSGSLTQFYQNNQYNNAFQGVGVDFYRDHSSDFRSYYGLRYALASYQDDYSYYSYRLGDGYYYFKYYPKQWMLVKGGVSLYYKKFIEEDAWNHWESMLYFQQNVFLKTKTTLRWGIDLLYRDFVPYESVGETTTWYSGRGGRRISSAVAEYEQLPTLWQASLVFRIAQSFGKHLGGFTEYGYRYNPSEGNPYELEIESFSPIDDYFGYEGSYWTANLKFRYNSAFWSAVNYYHNYKKYVNRPVYQYDFNQQIWVTENEDYIVLESNRIDFNNRIEFSFGYMISRFLNKASNLEIVGSFAYRKNDSNDPYFDYDYKSVGLQLKYDLQW